MSSSSGSKSGDPTVPLAHQYGWSCACGGVKFKMYGEPVRTYNCCCQSCHACAEAIMAKGGDGTSWQAPKSESPGVAIALWASTNVVPDKPLELASKVGYMKVTESGTMIRWYAKCCNTPIGNLGGPGNAGLNFNCVMNPDGSKYVRDPELLNIMYIYWKNPDEVPEPRKDDVRDFRFLMTVVPEIIKNKPWCFFTKKAHSAFLPKPADVTEVVPKTWTDP